MSPIANHCHQAKNLHSYKPAIILANQEQASDKTVNDVLDKLSSENIRIEIIKVTQIEDRKIMVLCSNREEARKTTSKVNVKLWL